MPIQFVPASCVVGASAALLHPVINFVRFASSSDLRPHQTTTSQNGTAKRCPRQGLQIQEQVRMLGFGHAYSRRHRCRAQRQGPCPGRCARKAGSCKSHDGNLGA